VWEEPVVEWFFFVPFTLLVVPVGGQTSEVTGVDLKTSFDVFGEEVWIGVVFWVSVTFSPEEDSEHAASKSEVEENHTGVELPSIGWLLVPVVSVFEVSVIQSVDFFSAHETPVAHGLGSKSVQFWVLVGEFWGLWEWNQETLVVIWVSVWVFKKLLVLFNRHHVARVVDEVLFDCGGADASKGQSAADCHT